MARRNDIQPWLDYFGMLQRFADHGYLEVNAGKHEAYVTPASLFTIAGCVDSTPQGLLRCARESVVPLLRRVRGYAAWLSGKGGGYLSRPFALTIVGDVSHVPVCTVVITSRRRWWRLWMWHDDIEIVEY